MKYKIGDKVVFTCDGGTTSVQGEILDINKDCIKLLYEVEEKKEGLPLTWFCEEDSSSNAPNYIIGPTNEVVVIAEESEEERVNNPSHYTKGGIQPLDYIVANEMSFIEGNVIKYVTRHKFKNGLEDLQKAKVYLDKLIEIYNDK